MKSFIALLPLIFHLSSLLHPAVAAPPADLVVLDARVITVDAKRPRAEAFAVSKGRFIAVGKTTKIKRLTGPKTTIIDAGGKTVTPGFNDAHIHPGPLYPASSPLASVDCRPSAVKTMGKLIAALKKKAKITRKGRWVRGSRYQETKLGRHPTRWDLDKASTDHPIRISHSSGHLSVFNSHALKLAGITKDTPDPSGGISIATSTAFPTVSVASGPRASFALPGRNFLGPRLTSGCGDISPAFGNTSAKALPAFRTPAPAIPKSNCTIWHALPANRCGFTSCSTALISRN